MIPLSSVYDVTFTGNIFFVHMINIMFDKIHGNICGIILERKRDNNH